MSITLSLPVIPGSTGYIAYFIAFCCSRGMDAILGGAKVGIAISV
jgi:hypothetical protein